MPGVQGPPVVLGDEGPLLAREAPLWGVVFDIPDRPSNVVGMVQEHSPPGPCPHGMFVVADARGGQCPAAGLLEVFDHFLRLVLVLADEQVDVIGHDGAGIAGVSVARYRAGESIGDDGDFVRCELQQREHQLPVCLLVEFPNVLRGRLDGSPAAMQAAEFRDDVACDRARGAAARIVRQPPTVGRADEMMCDDDRAGHGACVRPIRRECK